METQRGYRLELMRADLPAGRCPHASEAQAYVRWLGSAGDCAGITSIYPAFHSACIHGLAEGSERGIARVLPGARARGSSGEGESTLEEILKMIDRLANVPPRGTRQDA